MIAFVSTGDQAPVSLFCLYNNSEDRSCFNIGRTGAEYLYRCPRFLDIPSFKLVFTDHIRFLQIT